MVDDWEDKQGILKPYLVKKKLTKEEEAQFIKEWKKQGLLLYTQNTTPTRTQVIEILEKYNELLKEEYGDADLWDIISQTTDKFLLRYYPKID